MKHLREYNKFELFDSIFYYDPTSLTGLRWKIETKCRNPKDKRFPGDVAGSISARGYATVQYRGIKYFTHRVIYVLHNKSIEDNLVVDHINGKLLDNRIENLRLVSQSSNARNTGLKSTNTTGYPNVSIKEGYTKAGTYVINYVVSWTEEKGKVKNKSFSIFKYGLLPSFAMACSFREHKMKELIDRGFGYTLRHGKSKENLID